MLCSINCDDSNKSGKYLILALLDMGLLVPKVEEYTLQGVSVDERMRMALVRLREDLKNEGKKMYGYDYAWILQLIKEFNRKKRPEFKDYIFKGAKDYHDYLLELGIEGVAGVSVLYEYSNLVKEGEAKDWRFHDEPILNESNSDKSKRRSNCTPYERARRNGIVSRFLAIYCRNLAMAA